MRAISLWQPWASLWLSPSKVHETRHWATNVRGTVAVHAAQKFVKTELPAKLVEILEDTFGGHWSQDLPSGELIGTVDLVDCVETYCQGRLTLAASREDRLCGDWRAGRFAWRRSDSYQVFKRPIPYLGRQGFFAVDDKLVEDALRGEVAA